MLLVSIRLTHIGNKRGFACQLGMAAAIKEGKIRLWFEDTQIEKKQHVQVGSLFLYLPPARRPRLETDLEVSFGPFS